MPTRFKAVRFVLIPFVALVSLAVLAAVLALSSPQVRDWALAKARAELAGQAGLEMQYAKVSGSLLGTLSFDGFKLSRQGKPLARVERLQLRVNLLALLGGRAKLGLLKLVRPRVTLPPGGAPWSGGGGAPALSFSLNQVQIVDGSLEAPGLLPPLKKIEALNFLGRGRFDLRGLRAKVERLSLRAHLEGAAPLLIKGRGSFRRDRLTLEHLELSQPGNRVLLSGWLETARRRRVRIKASGELAQVQNLPWPWPGPQPPQAPLHMELNLTGTVYDTGLKCLLKQGAGSAQFSGALNLNARSGKLDVNLHKFDSLAWGLSPWRLLADGSLNLEGMGLPGRKGSFIRIGLDLKNLGSPFWPASSLKAEASLAKGRLEVASLLARGAWGSASGKGGYNYLCGTCPAPLDAQLVFSKLRPPAQYTDRLPGFLHGMVLGGKLRAHGKPGGVSLALELAGSVPNGPVDRLSLAAVQEGPAWRVESLELAAPWLKLSAHGSASRERAGLDFTAQAPALDKLAALGAVWQPLLAGLTGEGLTARGRFSGPWQNPDLEMQAAIASLERGQLRATELDLTVDLLDLAKSPKGRVGVSTQELWHGDLHWEQVAADAQMENGGAMLDLQAGGFGWRFQAGALAPNLFSRDFKATLLGMSLTAPQGETWQLQGQAKFRYHEGRVDLDGLKMLSGSQHVTLSGTYHPGGGISGRLEVSRFKLTDWLKGRAWPKDARLELSASLEGSLAQPLMDIKGSIEGLYWRGLPKARVRFAGSYQPGTLSATGRVFAGKARIFGVRADLGVDIGIAPPHFTPTQGALSARLRGSGLPLATLQPLLPWVSGLEGRLDADLTAQGSLARPELSGRISLDNCGLTIDYTGQEFKDINASLIMTGRRVTVQNLALKSGGSLDLKGSLSLPWQDGGELDLGLKAKDFVVSLGPWGKATIQGGLQLGGDFNRPQFTGTIWPSKLEVYTSVASPPELDEEVVILKPGQRPPPIRKPKRSLVYKPGGFMGRSDIEVSIQFNNALNLKLKDGWIELDGEIFFEKLPQEALIYSGEVLLVQGVFFIEGRRFIIDGGTVDFDGKDTPNPGLEIDANHRAGSVRVFVAVGGTANDPNIQLSSSPAMSRADILSTIIFGKPAHSLSGSQTRTLQAQALALLGQQSAREIRGILGAGLAPDIVTVHSEAHTGTSLEAGKYLSPDLYLRYRQNLSEAGGQDVGLEMRLKSWLLLESQWGSTQDAGVDMIFNWEF